MAVKGVPTDFEAPTGEPIAIVRQYGEQFRRPPRRKQSRWPKPPPLL
jgi:hypothetical protein